MIPNPVIRRLPKYMVYVQERRREGVKWSSSLEIAEALDLTSSTVRQDLSHVDLKGISKRGYDTGEMEAVLRSVLGADLTHRVVIVGAGHLGAALAEHGELSEHGFEIAGIFDSDPRIGGVAIGRLKVKPMSRLKSVVTRTGVDIGLIAVPGAAAQEVADRMVEAGVQAILNLTYAHVTTPSGVTVVEARILQSLQELAYCVGRDRDGGLETCAVGDAADVRDG